MASAQQIKVVGTGGQIIKATGTSVQVKLNYLFSSMKR